MNTIIIKGCLWLLGLIQMITMGINAPVVLSVLIMTVWTCLLSLLSKRTHRLILFISYSMLVYFEPTLVWGFPLIAFDYDEPIMLLLLGVLLGLEITPTTAIIIILACLAYHIKRIVVHDAMIESALVAQTDSQKSQAINDALLATQRTQQQNDDLELTKLNERNRIARDIHDNVGHLLSSAILQVGALQAINPSNSESLQTLKDILDQGMDSIRQSVHGLYDTSISLHKEIDQLMASLPALDVTLDYRFETEPPRSIQATLIFILKEALNNTLKHSNQTKVDVVLNESKTHYYCLIQDYGTTEELSLSTGIGLSSIEKRVSLLGGIMNIQTENGYRIYVNIPKEAL